MKRIADKIIDLRNLSIETKYIYGSRKALRYSTGKEYSMAKQYIRQEIDTKDNSFAVVDTNSTGLTMSFVSEMLERDIAEPLQLFYFFKKGRRYFLFIILPRQFTTGS